MIEKREDVQAQLESLPWVNATGQSVEVMYDP